MHPPGFWALGNPARKDRESVYSFFLSSNFYTVVPFFVKQDQGLLIGLSDAQQLYESSCRPRLFACYSYHDMNIGFSWNEKTQHLVLEGKSRLRNDS